MQIHLVNEASTLGRKQTHFNLNHKHRQLFRQRRKIVLIRRKNSKSYSSQVESLKTKCVIKTYISQYKGVNILVIVKYVYIIIRVCSMVKYLSLSYTPVALCLSRSFSYPIFSISPLIIIQGVYDRERYFVCT